MKTKSVGIIGKKLGMTQLYYNDELIGVTVIDFSGMEVIGKRTIDKNGYNAVILGYDNKKGKYKYIKEVRIDNLKPYFDNTYLNLFDNIKRVDVFGIMKGRGFAGAMKRWGFHGGPSSHGAKHWHRRTGSIGGHTFPAKTWKGQKMPGHYGNTKVCILNQKLIKVDKENKLLFIHGAVPGAKNSYVMVRESIKV